MDAVSLIHEHVDVEKLLHHYDFDHIASEGDLIRCCCKLHGGNNPTAFAIHRETGLWFCHTGECGGGDVFTLVERMERCDFFHAIRFLADFFGVDIQGTELIERKPEYIKELKSWMRFMKSRKQRDVGVWYPNGTLREVTKFRDFKVDTMQHFGLHFAEEVQLINRNGDPYTLHHRLMCPIVQNGCQVGASFRRIKQTDIPKWAHAPRSIQTGEMLYNYDAVQGENSLVVVEGIFDVWAYHEIGVTAVATFGAHLSEAQYRLLLLTGADIILSYDGDEAGRFATKKAIEQLKNKANLFVIPFDVGEDPESISREELQKRYGNKIRAESWW